MSEYWGVGIVGFKMSEYWGVGIVGFKVSEYCGIGIMGSRNEYNDRNIGLSEYWAAHLSYYKKDMPPILHTFRKSTKSNYHCVRWTLLVPVILLTSCTENIIINFVSIS